MSIFTFPFMVMNIGAALSNVDPTLEEAAACLGARPWQTFRRVLLPLTVGFNILLASESRPGPFWAWFAAGNLHLLSTPTVMPLMP